MSTLVPPVRRHCYVDEAGDPTLFSARGQVRVGEEGCSRYFMMGALEVTEPGRLAQDLTALRADLMADPYFRGVPSMQPEARKTAAAFHAKDDVAEVRREVFRVLTQHALTFFAVVRDKRRVLAYVQGRNQLDPAYRYQPNELYDTLVSRLFKNRLHLTPEVDVCFAARGQSDRTAALRLALDKARSRFESTWRREVDASIVARQSTPRHEAGLQAVDYFLWALQRHFERGESRYAELVWPQVGVVHAVDDTEHAAYGTYYTKKKPLTWGGSAASEKASGI
ncbi:DUF3800 domain-containing protein [Ideonella sp. 4Y11]|uniref:DUF3800 domain-containing protein n=1 Tax=Ideonella aquatica TaxID=2824119 RepID=A0A941BLR1_9BURK|nr:DUF3800 domain-containing protein [Ideonella aquatica]MBQ0959984.1 DUF3800 domain-containing protein [Ideonella aquatica]